MRIDVVPPSSRDAREALLAYDHDIASRYNGRSASLAATSHETFINRDRAAVGRGPLLASRSG